jgi:hypothetical protein
MKEEVTTKCWVRLMAKGIFFLPSLTSWNGSTFCLCHTNKVFIASSIFLTVTLTFAQWMLFPRRVNFLVSIYYISINFRWKETKVSTNIIYIISAVSMAFWNAPAAVAFSIF